MDAWSFAATSVRVHDISSLSHHHPALFRDGSDASPLASPPVWTSVICPLVACLVKIAIYGWVEGGPVQTWGGGTSFRGPT